MSSLTSSQSFLDISVGDTASTITDTSMPLGSHSSSFEEKYLLEPIAVIGLSFRFPEDATSEDKFWDMLMEKRCVTTEFPKERMNIDAFHNADKDKRNSMPNRGAHFLEEDFRAFDAQFFSIPPVEAATMDPQQRGLLETTYRALENAGIPMKRAEGSNTSVHVGSFTTDFQSIIWKDIGDIPKYSATGTAASILSNRLSWFFNFRGPSMTVDTACSSGMVALDLSCNSLWSGSSDMGVVAGSSLILSPEMNISLANMNFLSPDSRCYSFDHRANGYARGEGFGVLILKRLSQAIKDGDNVRALIRSSATNQDGYTPSGITQPSKSSQIELINQTYHKAGLDRKMTRYFEAHGTGTAIGDPIEAAAIGESFQAFRSEDEPLYVGAVKPNIGHLEGASGLAGVIKTILILEKGVIPPNTNFERLNPKIDAASLKIEFPLESLIWPGNSGIRRASVNSFGFGGTNAHVVLENAHHLLTRKGLSQQADIINSSIEDNHMTSSIRAPNTLVLQPDLVNGTLDTMQAVPKLIVCSAVDERSLRQLITDYENHINSCATVRDTGCLDDLAFTLSCRRTLFPWRSFAVINSALKSTKVNCTLSQPIQAYSAPRVGFVFTGQGAQWYAMGRELLSVSIFRESILRSQKSLVDLGCTWNLLDEILKNKEASNVNKPNYGQVMSTAIQVGLVDLFRALGVTPSVVLGHSSGEIAAAYCSGSISADSALRLSFHRGVLVSKLSVSSENSHAMASVGLSSDQVHSILKDMDNADFDSNSMTVSCINSPQNVTISGPEKQINDLVFHLNHEQIFARKLMVNVGYHSPQMSEIATEYLGRIRTLQRGTTISDGITMLSSVSGNIASTTQLCSGEYWVQNLVSPVNFLGAFTQCYKGASHSSAVNLWVEIGPHAALRGPIRDILSSLGQGSGVGYSSALVRDRSALESHFTACGELHCRGVSINLNMLNQCYSTFPDPPRVLSDLPGYPFNHTVTHWEEPRLSKELRFRLHPKNDFLGTRTLDWNSLRPTWKLTIRQDEMTWVKDHKVTGSILYPAAGMLLMAIEALKQIKGNAKVVGYEIKEAQFHAPLVVPDTSAGVDTQIFLNPSSVTAKDADAWFEFRIYSYNESNSEWSEVSRGHIRADYGRNSEVDGDREERYRLSESRKEIAAASVSCKTEVMKAKLYDEFRANGLDFGSVFQRLSHIYVNRNDKAIATINPVPHVKNVTEGDGSLPAYIIHPAMLDAILQMPYVALTRGVSDGLETMVPSRIKKLWLSSAQTEICEASCNIRRLSQRDICGSVSVLTKKERKLQVRVDALEITSISSSEDNALKQEPNHICYSVEWKPDFDLMSSREIQDYCEKVCIEDVPNEPLQWCRDLEYVSLAFAHGAVVELRKSNYLPSNYLKKYVAWIEAQLERDSDDAKYTSPLSRQMQLEDSCQLALTCDRLVNSNIGKVYVLIGKSLPKILLGLIDPLQLLFEDEQLLADFYSEMNEKPRFFGPLAQYLSVMTHMKPDMKILEIGAGTGGTTKFIHKIFAAESSYPRYSNYDFTDISPSFFAKAKENFASNRLMNFQVLNIEFDPATQGFLPETYDIIFAANVLHATRDIKATVSNTRKLLKTGGKLILFEATVPNATSNGFIFGLLPGWWLGQEDYRQQTPCISEERWDDVLRQSGFSGTDVVFRDFAGEECHRWSIMISTAVTFEPRDIMNPKIKFVLDKESVFQQQVAREIINLLNNSKSTVEYEVSGLGEVALAETNSSQHHIVLCEIERPVLNDVSADEFSAIQSLFSQSRTLFWITGGGGKLLQTPDYGVIQGLCRVARQEYTNLTALITVALDIDTSSSMVEASIHHASHIAKVFKLTMSRANTGLFEPEYYEINAMLHINRLIDNQILNNHILDSTTATRSMREFGDDIALKLTIRSPGMLDSLEFAKDDVHEQPLQPEEVEIRVAAIGVNFKDCMTLLGRVNTDRLGSECSGVITRIGIGCTNLQVGDRVTMLSLDTYQTYARSHIMCVIKIPDNMTFQEAAAIPTAFCTAYYSLCEVGRLQRKETILIHRATGGTGQAAVQLAQHIGAEVFATVGSNAKKQLLINDYNIPEDHIFYSRDTSFAEGIMRMTRRHGVNMVLNSLSGEALFSSWECIAPYGRFLEIGRKEIDSHGQLPMFSFIRNASFTGVDLSAITEQRPELIQQMLQVILSLVKDKALRPAHPLTIFPISESQNAFRLLQSGKSIGKIVLEISKSDPIPTILAKEHGYSFRNDATYVISGGLGGLGRTMARWLVKRGARYLLLLSRSGPEKNQKAQNMLAELRAKGITVEAPVCDVCDLSLAKVLTTHENMPPIKGALLAQMVIKNDPLASMSHEVWKSVACPKIQGSWNLHSTLPKGLDFFVILSSVTGIYGTAGQSNYAAGNTYQDALAQYRLSCGEKALSIDLGSVLFEGFLAENISIFDHLMRLGFLMPITPKQLLALLDFYCDPSLARLLPTQAQVVTGLVAPVEIKAKGFDVPSGMNQPIFRLMHQVNTVNHTVSSHGEKKVNYTTMFGAAKSVEEAALIVSEGLKIKLCRIVGMNPENVELHHKMDSYGLDSLITVELRNWLFKDVGADFTVFELVGDATFLSIGLVAANRTSLRQKWDLGTEG